MTAVGYEPPWAGIIETQPSPLELHALITPSVLLHMTPKRSFAQAGLAQGIAQEGSVLRAFEGVGREQAL